MPFGSEYTLALSRTLYSVEVLVAYNVSGAARTDSVIGCAAACCGIEDDEI